MLIIEKITISVLIKYVLSTIQFCPGLKEIGCLNIDKATCILFSKSSIVGQSCQSVTITPDVIFDLQDNTKMLGLY